MDRDRGRLCNREVSPGGGIQRGSSVHSLGRGHPGREEHRCKDPEEGDRGDQELEKSGQEPGSGRRPRGTGAGATHEVFRSSGRLGLLL